MLRRIIEINKEKCNGCGACADACHEGAIAMVDGKATLIRDDYCDGLGDCLPSCPADAITFVERDAAAYDEEAVKEHMARRRAAQFSPSAVSACSSGGCPGNQTVDLRFAANGVPHTACPGSRMAKLDNTPAADSEDAHPSQLGQWPCQIQLVPVNAPFFDGADLLVAADCTAYAYADMHRDFMAGKITLIGCPKLDPVDYTDKLTQIIANNDIKSVTMTRMQVPCCGGLERAVRVALQNSGKDIPLEVVTISSGGEILSRQTA